jgi:hypothetical protein
MPHPSNSLQSNDVIPRYVLDEDDVPFVSQLFSGIHFFLCPCTNKLLIGPDLIEVSRLRGEFFVCGKQGVGSAPDTN